MTDTVETLVCNTHFFAIEFRHEEASEEGKWNCFKKNEIATESKHDFCSANEKKIHSIKI